MNSLRKWFYRPRRDDKSLMAQFYYADEELNLVAGELDSFDGRKDPERCTALVNQLRQAQDKVLNICVEMMEELLPDERALRDFRVKFPDDVLQETLSGQLWFGAECLAAGSSILNRETESTRMRPLAKAVTKTIEIVRNLLREQCLKPIPEYTEKIRESLKIFDRLFADFELSYVSAMVPVKTVEEYEMQQNVVVLFSDTLQRAVRLDLVTQEQIDNYDPALMFTIPRLAIIAGLVIFPDGPLNLEKESKSLSELFRPFKTLLLKIRELLWTMSPQELATLEKCLCSMDEPDINIQGLQKDSSMSPEVYDGPVAYTSDFVHRFYANYPSCRQLTPEMISLCSSGKKVDKNERKRDRKSSRTRARQERQNERFLSRLTGIEERPRARRRSRRGSSQHSHTYQYPEYFQDMCPPPPPPPPPPPLPPPRHPYPGQEVESGPHCHTSSIRQVHPYHHPPHSHPPPPHPSQTNVARPHLVPYNSNNDRRHTNHSSKHHRSRQSCHSSRHRTDRINTIVCACGTTNSHVPHHSDRGNSGRFIVDDNYHNREQPSVYTINDCPYPNPSVCPVYRNPNYLGEVPEYHEPNTYQQYQSEDCDLSTSSNAESFPAQMELNKPDNIQSCVANAVIADPCILSPSSFYDQDNTSVLNAPSATQPELNPISYDLTRLTIVEESLNPERISCDDCNNIKKNCCDTSTTTNTTTNTCDTQIEPMEQSSDRQKVDTSEQSCLCPLNATEDQVDKLAVSRERSDSHPIPEPRHSHTTLRPYGSKVSHHMCSNELNIDSIPSEQKGSKSRVKNVDGNVCDDAEIDVESSGSTSPHHSGTEDDEEVALALQAAEVAVSWKARERFSDPSDLIQRLFVCISGVADQLQTNYASDLRKILRCVFFMNQTPEEEEVEVLEGKEHFPSRRETGNEDVTSTNGSEQLSVESAEDALVVIGTPEIVGTLNSPDEVSDMEDEEENSLNLSSSHSDESVSRSILHTSSVVVPPSVFNDHSLMQYSTMSPPPFSIDHNYVPLNDSHEIGSDNDSPSNEVSYSSEVSNSCVNPHDSSQTDDLVFNLNTISENMNSVTPNSFSIPINTVIPVATSSVLPNGAMEAPSSYSAGSPTPPLDTPESLSRRYPIVQEPPIWVPDNLAPRCMACGALFTVVRRRHHCRNCGKVFCGHCSRHSVPLPHFGIWKNVRVCNACFLYYVTSSADGSSALS